MSTPLMPLSDLNVGDVLKINKGFYSHYGCVVREGTSWDDVGVLEFAGDQAKDLTSARVRVSSLSKFSEGRHVAVDVLAIPNSREAVLSRMDREIGRRDYALHAMNCEHVARYVSTGVRESKQVALVFGLSAIACLFWMLPSGGALRT